MSAADILVNHVTCETLQPTRQRSPGALIRQLQALSLVRDPEHLGVWEQLFLPAVQAQSAKVDEYSSYVLAHPAFAHAVTELLPAAARRATQQLQLGPEGACAALWGLYAAAVVPTCEACMQWP